MAVADSAERAPRSGLRETKKRRARAALLVAAIDLFEEQGFGATRIAEIAERAEVSHATFFNYFAGKDGLISEWLRGLADDAFLRCSEATSSAPLRPAVRRNLREFSAWVEERPDWLGESWPRCRIGPLVSGARGAQKLVEVAQERGDLRRDVSPPQLGGLLMVVLVGAVGEWLAQDPRQDRLSGHVLRAVDLVLDGARRRSERVRPRGA